MIKKILGAIVLIGLVVLGTLFWLGTHDDPMVASTAGENLSQNTELVARGRYLSLVGNCVGCHTVKTGQPYAGGTPLPTPFGTMYGPNITPDRRYGIGEWTSDDFWRALHNGKGPGGKLLYPAFPYTDFTNVTREDSDALYAYFRTIPAAATPNIEHAMGFPFNQRILMSMWRALFFRPAEVKPDPGQSEMWNRGRYLVEGFAHCAACHAPRNALGASDLSHGMSGGIIPIQDWYAPPLTNDAVAGLGNWSADDIAVLLKTGVSMKSSVSGPMAEVIHASTQHFTDNDLLAIGTFLKSAPATPPTLVVHRTEPSAEVMRAGAQVYDANCVRCHQAKGEGFSPAWPPLDGNLGVVAPTPINAVRMVIDGGYAPATSGNPRPHGMPPFGQSLSDGDIAAVVTYIRNSWGNKGGEVTALEVKNARRDSAGQ